MEEHDLSTRVLKCMSAEYLSIVLQDRLELTVFCRHYTCDKQVLWERANFFSG